MRLPSTLHGALCLHALRPRTRFSAAAAHIELTTRGPTFPRPAASWLSLATIASCRPSAASGTARSCPAPLSSSTPRVRGTGSVHGSSCRSSDGQPPKVAALFYPQAARRCASGSLTPSTWARRCTARAPPCRASCWQSATGCRRCCAASSATPCTRASCARAALRSTDGARVGKAPLPEPLQYKSQARDQPVARLQHCCQGCPAALGERAEAPCGRGMTQARAALGGRDGSRGRRQGQLHTQQARGRCCGKTAGARAGGLLLDGARSAQKESKKESGAPRRGGPH